MNCTCSLVARPFPVTERLTDVGAYSITSIPCLEAASMAQARASRFVQRPGCLWQKEGLERHHLRTITLVNGLERFKNVEQSLAIGSLSSRERSAVDNFILRPVRFENSMPALWVRDQRYPRMTSMPARKAVTRCPRFTERTFSIPPTALREPRIYELFHHFIGMSAFE